MGEGRGQSEELRMPPLSARLGAVFELAGGLPFAVDVGCDHGYIPIALALSGRCSFTVAADIGEGPLRSAKENADRYGAAGKMVFIRSDGLANPDIFRTLEDKRASEDEKGALIMAGMGGILMRTILEGAEGLNGYFRRLVLSPQSDLSLVRLWLAEKGWVITDERMIREDGKYYTIMAAERSGSGETAAKLSKAEALYGPVLLARRDPVLLEYLNRQRIEKEKILSKLSSAKDGQRAEERRHEVEEELRIIRTVPEILK